jgi:hypothetical protein
MPIACAATTDAADGDPDTACGKREPHLNVRMRLSCVRRGKHCDARARFGQPLHLMECGVADAAGSDTVRETVKNAQRIV